MKNHEQTILMADNSSQQVKEYIKKLDEQYAAGHATEHSYRSALQVLLQSILTGMTVTNEPSRFKCGAPDFIIMRTKGYLPVAFIETKDIDDSDLDGKRQHKEQFARYRASLNNIIFTDYLDFHLYINGEHIKDVRIAETADNGHIVPIAGTEHGFCQLITMLVSAKPQPIVSATRLAEQMARKAQMLRDTIMLTLDNKDSAANNKQLKEQMRAMKKVLLHDITNESFADVYAQTIAYGMFAARLHDSTPDDFSRQEAAMLIPQTNPFLRKIFQSIAAYDPSDNIAWIIDDLAATFAITDMPRIMRGYGKGKSHLDPLINFYEDFLKCYNPKLRKKMGVWYTPLPVVRFIVRAVDDILRSDFNLPKGLADDSKIKCDVVNDQYEHGKRRGGKPTMQRLYHRVQILDPATGTGTFLAETIRCIYSYFTGMEGAWPSYVEEHLIPRLNGFEILMASYAIAHLKLDMQLQETGYKPTNTNGRLRIYLTNSLEDPHPDTGSLWTTWLSDEANAANEVKRDRPVMIMMGNPPYSGESSNKGEWILRLLDDYKKEPGGKEKLKEKNPKWLNDDYVKFMRLAQDYIMRNGEGILAFINPHGYLDNPTFRGMRWSLLQAYDAIYAINLHGNSKKKEACPDGSKDENVFDIMQGVSINIFIKTGKKEKNEPAKVFYADLWGKRHDKYNRLDAATIGKMQWEELQPKAPMYFFVPSKDNDCVKDEYNKGFSVKELFTESSVGIVTTKDSVLVCDSREIVMQRINDFIRLSDEELRKKYKLKDSRDWSIKRAKADVGKRLDENKIMRLNYRPFDTKFLYYTGKTNGIVARPRYHSLRHLYIPSNLALLTCRQSVAKEWTLVGITQSEFGATGECGLVDDCRVSNRTKERTYCFPLYKVGFADSISDGEKTDRPIPNFEPKIISQIEKGLGEPIEPLELFDYIYAVLHSPAYRARYRELLKIDFPRIPYPTQAGEYHRLARLGKKLRELHLMTDAATWKPTTTFPQSGDDKINGLRRVDDKVYINDDQYFGNVPEEAWTFFIGGYQPAQKWLKDRKWCRLSYDDIKQYCRIIYALEQTHKIMSEIDKK